VWSASQFNDYGMCGFRFYAKRLLKLEALKDPEEGMDAAQRGTLNHAILERTYRKLQEARATIEMDNLEDLLEVLREEAEAVFAEAPRELGFRESALWEQDKAILLRKLEKLVELDFTDSPIVKAFGSAVRTPYLLEAPFGMEDSVPVTVDLGDEVGPVRVLGYIDRIDRQDQSAIVIDYKSGSTTIPVKELEAGRNFQMMVYLLAAEAILSASEGEDGPTQVRGGLFWHLSNRQTSGAIHLDENGQTSIEQAKGHLARHIYRSRQGDFAVYPSKPDQGRCVRYCDFHQLCRVSVTNRNKA
jgi:ATP-dependent helicase/DNAse subunit B